jgi:hypothetical protein
VASALGDDPGLGQSTQGNERSGGGRTDDGTA